MGRHNLDHQGKQRFKRQLYYVIFILDQKKEDEKENFRQHLLVVGRDLLDIENDIGITTDSFTLHWSTYARVLYDFIQALQWPFFTSTGSLMKDKSILAQVVQALIVIVLDPTLLVHKIFTFGQN